MFALQVLNKALLIFGPTTSLFYVLGLFLSPVSPVFHTVVTVRIGLKTLLVFYLETMRRLQISPI